MRKCKECEFTSSKEDFPFVGYISGRPYWRRVCNKCYRKKRQNTRIKFRDDYRRWKRTLRCAHCGYSANTHHKFSSSALEFHHVVGDKSFNVSEAFSRRKSFESLQTEAAKCIVLCCRCHMEHHHPHN